MTPKELLGAGRLDDAVLQLTQEVKARPADTRLRVFLFELLCFQGEFVRAAKQLEVIDSQGDVANALAVQVYRDLLAAEEMRRQVFHNGALPKFYLSPPAYADSYVMLVKKLAHSPGEAASLVAAAEEQFPAVGGHLGDRRF